MAKKTGIAWTDGTWNPIRGCSPVSEGCRNCYAATMASRFSGDGQPYEGLAKNGRWTGAVRIVNEHLQDPLKWRAPQRIFVNSMSDLFHEALHDDQIDTIFGIMANAPQHTFQVLTKRPERMKAYLSKPGVTYRWRCRAIDALGSIYTGEPSGPGPLRNVWLGVSVEDQATADERIPLLIATPAAVRFISAEPLLGPLKLTELPVPGDDRGFQFNSLTDSDDEHFFNVHAKLDWVIVGGESGPGSRPFNVAWARDLVRQCKQHDVAIFVKQLGHLVVAEEIWPVKRPKWVLSNHPGVSGPCLVDLKGGDWDEWPADLRVREFPS
jgi:protein gp37